MRTFIMSSNISIIIFVIFVFFSSIHANPIIGAVNHHEKGQGQVKENSNPIQKREPVYVEPSMKFACPPGYSAVDDNHFRCVPN